MYQLLAEIDSLRRERHPIPLAPARHVSFAEADGDSQNGATPAVPEFPKEDSEQGARDWELTVEEPDMLFRASEYSDQPLASAASQPRTLQDLSVAAEDIDACFQMLVTDSCLSKRPR